MTEMNGIRIRSFCITLHSDTVPDKRCRASIDIWAQLAGVLVIAMDLELRQGETHETRLLSGGACGISIPR